MVKLVWKVAGQSPLAFPLRQERVSIGRDAGNDVRLPEPAVSARHATIVQRGGRVVVHDLKSSNGTWVNGSRIDNQELMHGDLVAFGRVVMHFVDESQEAPPPPARPAAGEGPRRVVLSPGANADPETTPATKPRAVFDPEATIPQLRAMEPSLTPTLPEPGALPEPVVLPQLPELEAGDTLPQRSVGEPGQPDLEELDRLLGSIRSFRDQEADQQRLRQTELMREWRETLGYAEAMKTRLAREPRIRYFEVSERRHEVVLRIVRAPGEPTRLLTLTWGHPEQRDKAPDGIWMRATNYPDRRFQKGTEAVRELVAMLAVFLA